MNEDEEIPASVIESTKLKADVIAMIYNQIGIDAVNVGELDLVLGVEYLKELEKKHDFPFISANLMDDNHTPIFKRYVIKKVNDKKVGIFGLMGDTSEMLSKVQKITDGSVNVQDPLQAAESVIQELTGKVDYIIALTHQKANRDWVISRRVHGINLMVGGHDILKTRTPSKAGETLIVRAGEKNQYQGMIEIALDGTEAAKNSLVPLGGNIADDPKVKAILHDYNDRVAELYSSALEKNRDALTNVASRSMACAPCHSEQVEQWQTTDHAKAYETLVKKSKQYDPQCLACHTTRFEQPQGFSMESQQPALVNVGCENCHGYAEDHLNDMQPIPIPSPDMQLCMECHTSDRCPGFEEDAQIEFEKITH